MLDASQSMLDHGVRNLLFNCADCQPGQAVLLVHETEKDGYYDPELVHVIGRAAETMGFRVTYHGVPLMRDVCDPDPQLRACMQQADCTVFLARLGDQIRFRTQDANQSQIVSYALDPQMLASSFGTADYRGFEALKQRINLAFATARDVHVTCPAGTDFRGTRPLLTPASGDVTRKRFPMSVFSPIPAAQFSGRIAQNGFLTGTGSQYYTPYACGLEDTLFVDFDGPQITGFDGTPQDVAAARRHYEYVGGKYGIDTYFVHSWHVGIHPGCAYPESAGRHIERWSGAAFGNPRLLHFHTCGAYPPGEISLNVLDPTIRLDGVAIWDKGRLHPERLAGAGDLFETYPDLADVFANPAMHVGQAASGQLALH